MSEWSGGVLCPQYNNSNHTQYVILCTEYDLSYFLKAGSQCDTRPCIALITCETQNF